MFTKTLAATATAALIAAGSLGASTTSASAHYHGHGFGGIYFGGYGIGRPDYGYVSGHKVCEPVFEPQKVWTSYGWTWTKVFVGNECHWVSSYGYGD